LETVDLLGDNNVARADLLTKVGFHQLLYVFWSILLEQQKQASDAKHLTIDAGTASKKGPSRAGCRAEAGEEEVQKGHLIEQERLIVGRASVSKWSHIEWVSWQKGVKVNRYIDRHSFLEGWTAVLIPFKHRPIHPFEKPDAC
jgi:hypothetical protein